MEQLEEIKRKTSKNKIVKGTFIFLGMMLGLTVLSKTIYTLLLPQVEAGKVGSGTIEDTFYLTGQIGLDKLAIDKQKVTLKMPQDGSIAKCMVEEGQSVSKGDPLFRIITQVDEKEAAQTAYEQAESAITAEGIVRQKEEKLQKKERLTAALTAQKEILEKGETTYEIQETEREIADKEKEKVLNEQLYAEGAISKDICEKLEEDIVLLKNKKADLMSKAKKEIQEKIQDLQEQIDEVDIGLNELADKEALEKERRALMVETQREIVVTSPIDGVIYEIDIAVGATAAKEEQLAIIIPNTIKTILSFGVEQKQADQLRPGKEVDWQCGDKNGHAVISKKTYNEKDGTTLISCELEEQDESTMMTDCKTYKAVDVEITNQSDMYDVILPNSAISYEGHQAYIFTLEEVQRPFEINYYVHKVQVTVVKEGDSTSAVSAVISYGQSIIKSTSKPLEDGMEVSCE